MGCTACYSTCSHGAVKMKQSEKGFYISFIDTEKCTQCGLCEKICPVLNKSTIDRDLSGVKCYATYTLDEESRMKSTSGGVFYELAKRIIHDGGAVCGCIWDKDFVAKHVCTDDLNIVEKMRGSKYVQSDLGNCLKEVKNISKTRKVLFCGLPCQVTALKNSIKDTDNILSISLICGGCPSPEVWRLYKEDLEKREQSKITYINHRSKSKGWLVANMQFDFQSGNSIHEVIMQNIYGANYVKGLTICGACFECSFKINSLNTDIIIGDHWGINKKMMKGCKNKGASVVIPLTLNGKKIFSDIESLFNWEMENLDNVITVNPPLVEKHKRNNKRDSFFNSLHTLNISENLSANMPEISHGRIKKILYKLGVYIPIYNLIWKLRHR
ncbi:Coenzyme F420 hydrogenase/dehydrogenase, beta subunit C-terminal domain [Ruminococcus sp. OA3]|nr:Coenzyme F420 hydrogenase/dehydrogenase, beta subunit C-terminal domain [Ruminococcus sp. OA3]